MSLMNSSKSAQEMAMRAEGASVNLVELTNAEKAAAVGANIMNKAFNIFKNLGVMLVINLAVSGIEKLYDTIANYRSNIYDAYNDTLQDIEDRINEDKDNLKSISNLVSQYDELAQTTNLTNEQKQTLINLQDELITSYGAEAKGIDLINGKYDENIAKLKELNKEQQKRLIDDSYNKYLSTQEGFTDKNKYLTEENEDWLIQFNQIYRQISGEQLFPDDYDGLGRNSLSFDNARQAADIIEQAYETLLNDFNFRENNEQSWVDYKIKLGSIKSEVEEIANKTEDSLSEYVQTVVTTVQDVNNIDFSQISESQYNYWKDEIIKQYGQNDNEINNAIAKYLDDTYSNAQEIANQTTENVFNITSYADDIDNLQTKIKSLKDTLTKLKDGSITQDELIDFTQEYDLTEYIDDIPRLQTEIEELLKTAPNDLIKSLEELKENVNATDAKKIDSLTTALRKLAKTSSELANVNDVLEGMKEVLEGITDYYETAASVAEEYCNNMQEYWESQKDYSETYWDNLIESEETYWDNQINALETEKNALQDEQDEIERTNDLLEKQKAIREAQIALENAKNNKTVIAYTETYGFRLEANQTDIKNAQDDLDEANKALEETIRSNEIEDIENSIDSLTEQKEKAVESLENQKEQSLKYFEEEIEGWKNYAQQWNDIVDAYEKDTDRKIAAQILGTDWEVKLSNKSQSALTDFANGYSDYQIKLEDVNNQIAKMEGDIYAKRGEEVDTYISKLEQLEQTYNKIISISSSVGAVLGGSIGSSLANLMTGATTSASLGLATASINASSNYTGFLGGIQRTLNNINQNLKQPSTSNYELNLNGNIVSDNPDRFANFLEGVINKMKNR